MNPNDLDEVLELLEDKLVRTKQGSYISVEALRGLVKEQAEMKAEEKQLPRHRSMHAARGAAMKDEELLKMFGKPAHPTADVKPEALLGKERQAQPASRA